jgi:hypothetical protein
VIVDENSFKIYKRWLVDQINKKRKKENLELKPWYKPSFGLFFRSQTPVVPIKHLLVRKRNMRNIPGTPTNLCLPRTYPSPSPSSLSWGPWGVVIMVMGFCHCHSLSLSVYNYLVEKKKRRIRKENLPTATRHISSPFVMVYMWVMVAVAIIVWEYIG